MHKKFESLQGHVTCGLVTCLISPVPLNYGLPLCANSSEEGLVDSRLVEVEWGPG